MPNVISDPPKWKERFVRSGYFLTALLLHLIVFVMVATCIVFSAPEAPPTTSFLRVATAPVPPPAPPPPPPSGGDVRNALEPSVQVAPPPAALSVVVTSAASMFNVNSVKVAIPNLPPSVSAASGSGLSGHGLPGEGSGLGSAFGSNSNSNGTSQLEGYLYDLKQTSDNKPSGLDIVGYHNKLKQFIDARWDATVLDKFYKGSAPLYASAVFIPTIDANNGPKAFGLEKEVSPGRWVVWYQGKAAPTQDGDYRFVGVADDILAVAVDHRTVLDGSLYRVAGSSLKRDKYPTTHFQPSCASDANLFIGESFHVGAGEQIDIDILIGEEPGGSFNAFLFLQRDQSTYDKQDNGTPLLPIFQLGASAVTPVGKPQTYPPYSAAAEPWTAGN